MASLTIYLLSVTTMKAANLKKELPLCTFQYYVILHMEVVQVIGVLYFKITY